MALEAPILDIAELLTSEEAIELYLAEAFDDGDPELIASAIGDAARARVRNMSALAREANITRETLYRSFAKGGNPTLSTLTAVLDSLGFQLMVKPKAPAVTQ